MKKYAYILPIIALWAALTLAAWLSPPQAASDSERRPLAQFPEISAEAVTSGGFMKKFESYTLDQFPLRDRFRQLKSVFSQYVLLQQDNNGIYLADGYAAKQEYPLNQSSVNYAISRFNALYERYLRDSRVWFAMVPDKGYYLAQPTGHLSLDYSALEEQLEAGLPWARHISLTDTLSVENYYFTDTHWRQETLIPTARHVASALGVTQPQAEDFTVTALQRPFYGVYYGQAALPMDPETIYLMESDWLNGCTVYDHETGKTGTVYDMTKLTSRDLYDVYLSGARSLLTIENPAGDPEKELIIFRDSFGSSLIPLLIRDYGTVTVIDTRYIHPDLLDRFVEFRGQDVLMLYSTLVLNQSASLQ